MSKEMGVCGVPEREERPSPQQAEHIIELTETRKSLDSFNPPPPVPVLAQMASMNLEITSRRGVGQRRGLPTGPASHGCGRLSDWSYQLARGPLLRFAGRAGTALRSAC